MFATKKLSVRDQAIDNIKTRLAGVEERLFGVPQQRIEAGHEPVLYLINQIKEIADAERRAQEEQEARNARRLNNCRIVFEGLSSADYRSLAVSPEEIYLLENGNRQHYANVSKILFYKDINLTLIEAFLKKLHSYSINLKIFNELVKDISPEHTAKVLLVLTKLKNRQVRPDLMGIKDLMKMIKEEISGKQPQ